MNIIPAFANELLPTGRIGAGFFFMKLALRNKELKGFSPPLF
jgi:hypothetical protein